MTSVHLTVCLFICLTRPPQLASFVFLLQTHTPHPLPQCACWRDPTKVPLIKIGCRVKKERVCGTFAQAHTPTPSPLEGPYKTTVHKNGGAREKRAYVWELCLGTHVPNSSKRALALAVSLSNSFGPEVALTLFSDFYRTLLHGSRNNVLLPRGCYILLNLNSAHVAKDFTQA